MEDVKSRRDKKYAEQKQLEKKKYGETEAGKIKAAEERAWKEFITNENEECLIDLNGLQKFPDHYVAAIKRYEPVGVKLANKHSAWLTSLQLSNWMDGVHDKNDIRSGFAFRESLAQCIGQAISTEQCQQTLERWMTFGKLSDTENLYVRALLFNHEEIIKAAELDSRNSDFKPKYLLSIYKGALGRLSKHQAAHLVDHLALTTANFLARALGQATNVAMRNLVLASLTLQARTYIVASNMTRPQLQHWVMETARQSGINVDKNYTMLSTAARKEAKRVIPRSRLGPVACAFELDAKELAKEGRISTGALKTIGIPGQVLIKQWFDTPPEFNTGVVGVILQIAAFYFACDDIDRSDKFDDAKFTAKAGIAAVSLCATLLECVTATLEKKVDHPLSKTLLGQWALSGGGVSRRLKAAKMGGAVAGVINAGYDIWSAWDAWNDGNWLLGITYATSAVLSGGLAIFGVTLGSTIFWPLFAATFVLGIVIGFLRPAPLKKWVGRSYFRNSLLVGEVKRYGSLDEELEEFCNAARG